MAETRVLVAYASERGSTAEIAEEIGRVLTREGFENDVRPAAGVGDVTRYRAVVLGSAVYMNRWRKDAIRFLKQHRIDLAGRTVWLFQSGPLDDENAPAELPRKVRALAAEVGARPHLTFGGRLSADATGFVAGRMASRGMAGDFRDFEQIRRFAEGIAQELRRATAAA